MRLKYLFILFLLPLFVILTANKAAEKMPSKPIAETIDKTHKSTFVERFLIKKMEKKLLKSLVQQDSARANVMTEEVKKGKEAVSAGKLGLLSLVIGLVIGFAASSLILFLGIGLAIIFAIIAISKSGVSKTSDAQSGRCLGISILIVVGLIAYWIYRAINSG